MNHYFSNDEAIGYGLNEAIILNMINRSAPKDFWNMESLKKFLPFLNEKEINQALQGLIDHEQISSKTIYFRTEDEK